MARSRSLSSRVGRQGVRLAGSGQVGNGLKTRAGGPYSRAGGGGATTDLKAVLKPRRAKYHNVPVETDGYRFDSKRERDRYLALRDDLAAGMIRDLRVHERFPLVVRGEDCGAYEADFTYLTAAGEPVVEDVKSAATRKLPTYRLKAKMLWALYGLRVQEV